MAHYAFLDSSNYVTHVIVGRDEDDTDALPDGFDSWEAYYGDRAGQTCLRTSYNSRGNEHSSGGVAFRTNFAGVGYFYDSDRDAFIPPQPYRQWTLDDSTLLWVPPVPCPDDGNLYYWDEYDGVWVLVGPAPP